jgi:hypothetical protein
VTISSSAVWCCCSEDVDFDITPHIQITHAHVYSCSLDMVMTLELIECMGLKSADRSAQPVAITCHGHVSILLSAAGPQGSIGCNYPTVPCSSGTTTPKCSFAMSLFVQNCICDAMHRAHQTGTLCVHSLDQQMNQCLYAHNCKAFHAINTIIVRSRGGPEHPRSQSISFGSHTLDGTGSKSDKMHRVSSKVPCSKGRHMHAPSKKARFIRTHSHLIPACRSACAACILMRGTDKP